MTTNLVLHATVPYLNFKKWGVKLGVKLILLTLTVRIFRVARIYQPVQRFFTGWVVQESKPRGEEILRAVQTALEAHSLPLYNGYRFFLWDKAVGAWC